VTQSFEPDAMLHINAKESLARDAGLDNTAVTVFAVLKDRSSNRPCTQMPPSPTSM
jgi:hypothetical protein